MTKRITIDYDAAPTQQTTLSTLAAIIPPRGARELNGLYEMHNVAIIGVSACMGDGTFQMRACNKCFCQVAEASADGCSQHPDAGTTMRWLFQLELADGETTLPATLYNDAVAGLNFLPKDPVDTAQDAVRAKIVLGFRALLWSLRLVFRPDNYKDNNYVEIKRIAPTITVDGLIETYVPRKSPQAAVARPGCPLARCAEVDYDVDFGTVTCKDVDAMGVRVFVKIAPHEEGKDPELGMPDPTGNGLRVVRKVTCAVDGTNDASYYLVMNGLTRDVQWLLGAKDEAVFFITGTAKPVGGKLGFLANAHLDVSTIGVDMFTKHYKDALDNKNEEVQILFSPSRASPMARKRTVDEALGADASSSALNFGGRRMISRSDEA